MVLIGLQHIKHLGITRIRKDQIETRRLLTQTCRNQNLKDANSEMTVAYKEMTERLISAENFQNSSISCFQLLLHTKDCYGNDTGQVSMDALICWSNFLMANTSGLFDTVKARISNEAIPEFFMPSQIYELMNVNARDLMTAFNCVRLCS